MASYYLEVQVDHVGLPPHFWSVENLHDGLDVVAKYVGLHHFWTLENPHDGPGVQALYEEIAAWDLPADQEDLHAGLPHFWTLETLRDGASYEETVEDLSAGPHFLT